MALVAVEGLTRKFGGLAAVQDVSLSVEPGETLGVIGPNGAGKSTLFGMIAGAIRPTSGRMHFQGEDVTRWSPDQAARTGVARTHQTVRTFRSMTVIENVAVGAYLRHRSTARATRRAGEILEELGLSYCADRPAVNLPIAVRKRIEVARALATEPQLILLDEMMSGLTPVETTEAVELVRRLGKIGITVMLVEHVMEVVMPLSSRIVVLDHGVKIAEGTPNDVAKNPAVIDAYLGAAPMQC